MKKWCPGAGLCSPHRHLRVQLHKHSRQFTYWRVIVNRHILCVSLCVSTGGHDPPPLPHVYIHRQLHRSVFDTVNHYELSFRSFAWVADMHIYSASQTCRTWLTKAHWQALSSFWTRIPGTYNRACTRLIRSHHRSVLGNTSEARMWDIRTVFEHTSYVIRKVKPNLTVNI